MLALGLVTLGLLAVIFRYHTEIVSWAIAQQRDFQNGLARGLRALKAGDAGAWAGFISLCGGYGFLHAVGPGHGKFLMGAYSAARPVRTGPLILATVAASLGQALTAVLLVAGGIGLFALTRQQMTTLAETTLTQLSLVSILLIGLWLVLRGSRRVAAVVLPRKATHPGMALAGHAHPGSASDHGMFPVSDPHHNHHHHDHGCCSGCGHAHAPSPQAIAAATTWRELAGVIGAIAIRPCSGAVLLLVLTWQMNILPAGIAGVFAMATGTACLTLLVALMGQALRTGALAGMTESNALRVMAASLEMVGGLAVVLLAGEGLGLI
ncbi:nickel/cobalt transporter [Paracoccus benzoatiresistens]|uniref:Nickel/cobalt efflux system n=1 Tax=Paracoccus benzoatiresistens TaxID=2997341 RepID=A0ABT4J777_9RHOB|nr:hypothetical protein [Paracoccus sp. EF6]MCZ0962457.1 hypothetical protein [Paracoccus sp. EF6]